MPGSTFARASRFGGGCHDGHQMATAITNSDNPIAITRDDDRTDPPNRPRIQSNWRPTRTPAPAA